MEHDPSEILRLLDLEELDTDLYRANNPTHDEDLPLFGGQVAAQALLAAALTVPEGRFPHSMHGYFLRPGHWQRPIVLHVDRDRDGRSYSARHVVARQNGEAIFTLSASFHDDESGADHDEATLPPGVIGPEEPEPAVTIISRPMIQATLDIRLVDSSMVEAPSRQLPSRFWARTRMSLSDDPLIHVCAMTFLSDVGSGYGQFIPDQYRGGPSLDHAMWFHRPVRLDDWVLVDLHPVAARGTRGLYTGTIYDRAGNLAATVAQQHILRPHD